MKKFLILSLIIIFGKTYVNADMTSTMVIQTMLSEQVHTTNSVILNNVGMPSAKQTVKKKQNKQIKDKKCKKKKKSYN